jgi:hypothetical protein
MKEVFDIFRRLFVYDFLIRNFGVLGQAFVIRNISKRLTERRPRDGDHGRLDRR